mgnify:CR=1 FL=1
MIMWYVIWVATNKEQQLLTKIENELNGNIYSSVKLPMKVEKRKYKGEWLEIEKLLFPGYLFVDTDNIKTVADIIRDYQNCIGVLKIDGQYIPITKKEEAMLYKLTGDDGRVGVSTGYIEEGRVKVIDGPLQGLEEYIVSVNKHKRVAKIKLELFGEERTFTAALELVDE